MPYPHPTKLSGHNAVFIDGNPSRSVGIPSTALEDTAGGNVAVDAWPVALINTAPTDNISIRFRKSTNGFNIDSDYIAFIGALVTNGDNPERPVARHLHGTIMIRETVVAFPFISYLESTTPTTDAEMSMREPHYLPIESSLGDSTNGYHYVSVNTVFHRAKFGEEFESVKPIIVGWAIYNRSNSHKTDIKIMQGHIEVMKFDKQYNIFEPIR